MLHRQSAHSFKSNTAFKLEDNANILADCVYSGNQIANFTTDQLGRKFHNPPSIGTVELSEDVKITTTSLTAGTLNTSYLENFRAFNWTQRK